MVSIFIEFLRLDYMWVGNVFVALKIVDFSQVNLAFTTNSNV